MVEPEEQAGPSSDEALETLRQLADVFLQGGARPRAEAMADADDAKLQRPATIVVDEQGKICAVDSDAEKLLGRKAPELVGALAATVVGRVPIDDSPLLAQVRRSDGSELTVFVTRSEVALEERSYSLLILHVQNLLVASRTELRY